MILQTNVLNETQKFVESLFEKHLPANYTYHSLRHTKEVVAAAQVIGTKSGLPEEELEICLLAAWLHDSGYCFTYDGHEDKSIEIANSFLHDIHLEQYKIDQVAGCIAATKAPQQPKNLMEEVLCDADMYHVTSEIYIDKAEQLREELCSVRKCFFSQKQWMQMNREFLKKQQFFTEYGKTHMALSKEKNIKKLKKIVKDMEEEEQHTVPSEVENIYKGMYTPDADQEKQEKKKKKKDKHRYEYEEGRPIVPVRGIETMFRTMSVNQMELSSIADNKANIMITVNSIILSIVVSILGRRLEEYPNFYIPTLILTIVCLATIVFAVLATRPNVTTGVFSKEDVHRKRTNLLFFGNFHNMKLEDYEWGIGEMMKDSDYLYGSMVRDNYFLGIVLGKKYKLLRIAYTVFMFGLVIAFMAYLIAIFFFPV